MAINGNFPNTSPSLLLDFAKTEVLDPRITFTRTTTATYYDGITTTKADQNLILQSQDFATTWTATNSNVSVNVAVAPDNTSTADRLEFNGGSAACRVNQTITANNVNQIFSVFVKNDGVNYIQLSTNNSNVFADFDLVNVTVGTTGASATANITASANNYVRCAVAFNTNAVSSVRIQGVDSNTAAHDSILTNAANVVVWGAQLEQRTTNYPTAYLATTTAGITNFVPTLMTAQAGIGRFDHNPTTGESLGYLAEPTRTNLFSRSEEFDNAFWTKTRSTIIANTVVAPDGTLTADKLVSDTSNNTHFVQNASGVAISNATAITATVYIKKAEYRYSQVILNIGVLGGGIIDLDTGTLSSVTGTATSQSVGNGWYRVSVTQTSNSTSGTLQVYARDNTNASSYTGDGYSGIYIWGAQLESGIVATSYIPTTTTSVTRNFDLASFSGTNLTSWFNGSEGTIVTEHRTDYPYTASEAVTANIFPTVWTALGGSASTSLTWYGVACEFFINGTYNNQGVVPSGYNKYALSVATTGGQSRNSLNGASAVNRNGTTFGYIAPVNFYISGSASNQAFGGRIRRLAYYPKALTATEIANLTGS